MLKTSLALSGKHHKNVLKHRSKLIASNQNRLPISCESQRQYSSSIRSVATTTSSKSNQVARQQQEESPLPRTASNNSTAGILSSEKYQSRLDNLPLWHSVEIIKKLGHRLVQLDPLNIKHPEMLKDLSWKHTLVNELKSSRSIVPTKGFLETSQPLMAVNELIDSVWNIYAGNDCGIEFSHMNNQQEVEWLTSQWEKLNEIFHLDHLDQQNLATLLLECETFDHFMAAKFPTTKRYGCEGAEPMLVVLDEILHLSHLGEADVDEMTSSIGRIDDIIIGMPHRGRLNVLACLLGFDPSAIFCKTRGEPELDLRKAWMAKCDVLSHLSTNVRFVYGLDRHHIGLSRDTPDPINVTLLPNPSHLEIAAPMVAGSARGRAHNLLHGYSSSPKLISINGKLSPSDNNDYQKYFPSILPVQIHGDASVSGQGIIQETLQMSNLPRFSVGGSLHLVVNNQIGYTTDSFMGRSSRYCTDIFKFIEAPIIHVNAQHIPSVIRATRLALTYRQKFGKDVAIDLICYRQHGHNEMDEPSFTQPSMYSKIRNRKSIPQTYCDEIGMDQNHKEQIVDHFKSKLQEAYKKVDKFKPDNDNYRNFNLPSEYHRNHVCSWQTGCDLQLLKEIALASVNLPQNFNIHPNLQRILVKDRRQKFEIETNKLPNTKVDWATAEILAIGSLLKQNNSVRIAGQDVARGTFSTRHAALFDQITDEPYIPLNNMAKDKNQKAQLEIANTILSEEAALAYEFAYSVETCALTIWEAQFGDFFNTAQSVIDTLVSSSESKWLKQSPLTLLLPHGLDGAGPEHSSSHIERFLQLSSCNFSSIDTEASVNWSICFPTLPSQYFHLLRRQVLRPFRKPLVVLSPKVIFRHPDCISNLSEFAPEKSFEPVLNDPTVSDPTTIDTLVFCSGKVYFSLKEQKMRQQMSNVAIIRIEELCPFPIQSLVQTIKQYPNVNQDKMVWLQEEHKNQGAYGFVDARIRNLTGSKLRYIGRRESDLPATGCSTMHKKEAEQIAKEFCSLGHKRSM